MLGPGALDRCADSKDLLRREIAKALVSPCRVIPVLLTGFVFPPAETLPEDIRKLPAQNGIQASMPHFDSTFSKLLKLLVSKPVWHRRPRVWTALLAAAAVLVALVASFFLRPPPSPNPYPSTRAEVQQVNQVIAVVSRQIEAYQESAAARSALVAKARRAAELSQPAIFEDALPLFGNSMAAAISKFAKTRPAPELLAALGDSPLPVDVLSSLFDVTSLELDDSVQKLPVKLAFYATSSNSLTTADRLDCIDRVASLERLNAQWFALGVIELFGNVSPPALADFKKFLPVFTSIPRLSQPWPADKEQHEIELQAVLENIQRAVNETTALTGRLNLEPAARRTAVESLPGQDGDSPPDESGGVSGNSVQSFPSAD